jgi:hypothetical protein
MAAGDLQIDARHGGGQQTFKPPGATLRHGDDGKRRNLSSRRHRAGDPDPQQIKGQHSGLSSRNYPS